MTPTPLPTLRVGDVVAGRYRLEAQIGQGGFGSVYRATQLNLGRLVALKLLHAEVLANDEGLVRFQREAQLAQRLEHPHVVRLYDFGQAENGVPFIAFELLRGESVDEALRRGGPMSAGRTAKIALQVLKALMEAHAHGIVHRDIKPANIFLCEFQGETDFVKVLDFGIAKAPATATSPGLTQSGHVIGTPHYMAPEILLGSAPTPPADLYALGLVMAETIYGQMIFQGAATDVCLQQIGPDPVPLPAPVLQSPLGAIVHRATQKDPTRRFTSATEMRDAIETIVRGVGGDLDRPSGITAPTAMLGAAPMTSPMSGRPASPYVPIGGPAMAAPAVHAAARGNQTVLVVLLVLIAIVVAGGAGAGYLLVVRGEQRDKSSKSSSDDGDEAKDQKSKKDPDDKKKKKKSDEDDDDPPGDSIDAEVRRIQKILKEQHWTVVATSSTKSAGIDVRVMTLQKGADYGGVYIYVYETADAAKQTAKAMGGNPKNKMAAKAIGNRVYMALAPPDLAAAEDLLDQVLP